MNKHKYFRVKRITYNNSKSVYEVEAADSLIEVIFGCWSVYPYKNETLKEAIQHIELLNEWRIKSEKIVYKKKVK